MHLQVSGQAACPLERLVAAGLGAFVWLLVGVHRQVPPKVALPLERLVAAGLGAFEWLLVGVHRQVLPKGALPLERLPADTAIEGLEVHHIDPAGVSLEPKWLHDRRWQRRIANVPWAMVL